MAYAYIFFSFSSCFNNKKWMLLIHTIYDYFFRFLIKHLDIYNIIIYFCKCYKCIIYMYVNVSLLVFITATKILCINSLHYIPLHLCWLVNETFIFLVIEFFKQIKRILTHQVETKDEISYPITNLSIFGILNILNSNREQLFRYVANIRLVEYRLFCLNSQQWLMN